MTKRLFSRLILPLALLFIIALFLHREWQADGFFLNLSTEIIGILITILYVDWIFKQHERQRWSGTDKRIADRLRILLNATVSGIRDGLSLSSDILDQRVINSQDINAIHDEMIRIAEHVISPIVPQKVRVLDQRDWKSLATHIANSHNGILTFLNAFQTRMSPEQISSLLDLQQALNDSLTFYQVFPDLAGVPANQLPQARTPPEFLQQWGYDQTAKDIQTALALTKRLSQLFAYHS